MAAAAVTVEKAGGGVAVVMLRKEPVNSMNLDVWQQLLDALVSVEADPEVRGVIFTSGLQRDVFTAGNDLAELYAPLTSEERYTRFWLVSTTFLARLLRSPLVTVCAIRGACPAGGCCLALCCDFRIMTDAGHMGLNEVALGIAVPECWGALMAQRIGAGAADKMLQFARLVSPQEALKLGLVDQLVSKEELASAADKVLRQALKLPDIGRQLTKGQLHDAFSRAWEAQAADEAKFGWQMLKGEATVTALGAVLNRLQSGRKAKL